MRSTGVFNELLPYEKLKYEVKDKLPFITKLRKKK